MNKKEVCDFWKMANDLCVNQNECKDCPFYVTEIGCCSLLNLGSLRVEKCVSAFLAKEDNEISKPMENVGTIVVKANEPSNFDLQKPFFTSGVIEPVGNRLGNVTASSVVKHDNVNSPKHYCKGGLECIEVIKAQLTPEQNKGYLYGNVLKYMWRWPEKNGLEDLRKAAKYLDWLQQEVKK